MEFYGVWGRKKPHGILWVFGEEKNRGARKPHGILWESRGQKTPRGFMGFLEIENHWKGAENMEPKGKGEIHMSQHTPGPWRTTDRYIWATSTLLARVYKQEGQGEANARLIAAAPEMLALLGGFLSYSRETCADDVLEGLQDDAHALLTTIEGQKIPK